MIRYTLLILCFAPLSLLAQQKLERESRIKPNDVPEVALGFLENGQVTAKTKWYFEENLEGNSIEAKFRQDGHRYSVEFDTLGLIQDIEIEVKELALETAVLSAMTDHLGSTFTNYRIRKIQVQYSGAPEVLNKILASYPEVGVVVTRYEVVVKGRNAEETALYEFTFDEAGEFIKQQQIIFKNANHLEY